MYWDCLLNFYMYVRHLFACDWYVIFRVCVLFWEINWITHHHENSGSNHNVSSRSHATCISQKGVEIFRFDSAPYSHAENHDSTYPEHKVEGEKQVLQALHPTTEVGHLESNTNTLVCWKFPHSISRVSKNIQFTDTNVILLYL